MPRQAPAKTRSQSIAEILRAAILRGDHAPGVRMQEVPLAEELNVSRTPVREALRSLAEDGLLEYAANRGYRVRRFSTRDILISFRARAAMEGLGCRLIAERGLSEKEAILLEEILHVGDQLLAAGSLSDPEHQQWRRMNREFHRALLKMADSHLLEKIARDSRTLPIVNEGSFHWYSAEDFRRSHDHHHMIVRALIKGDGEQAEWWMREHIRYASDIVRKGLLQQLT